MRFWISLLSAVALWVSVVHAQDGGGRIERLIESTLSGPGRQVDLTGFRGALTQQARFERMTIADSAGVWLQIDDAVLDWDFAALARGTLQIAQLSAARIEIQRGPLPAPDALPSPTASGFSIPDLPVAIQITQLAVPELILGPDLLGEAMTLSIAASARLASGGAELQANADRTDSGGVGAFILSLAYDPTTEQLRIEADLREGPSGLVARAAGLPGEPALDLTIAGTGPLDAFAADISLRTDDVDRLTGRVTVNASGVGERVFDAELGGDIRPLLQADTRDFFGDNTRLVARGQFGEGVVLDQFSLETAQLTLGGTAALDATGAPQTLRLRGRLAGAGAVRLPGTQVDVSDGQLALDFNAARGSGWTLAFTARDVQAPGLSTGVLQLDGQGALQPGQAVPFAGDLTLAARNVAFDDPDLQQALGGDLRLSTNLSADDTGRLVLDDLQLIAPNMTLDGTLSGAALDGHVTLDMDAAVTAPDLSALGGLIAPVQAGAVAAQMTGRVTLPGGTASLTITGNSRDLDIGQPRLAPFLVPDSTLRLVMRRDETGTRLDTVRLTNSEINATGNGFIEPERAALQLTADLADLARLDPALSGAARLNVTGTGNPADQRFDANVDLSLPYATLTATIGTRPESERTRIDWQGRFEAPDLSPLAPLLAPVARGTISTDMKGSALLPGGPITASIDGTTQNLDLGIEQLAPLLVPETRIQAEVQVLDETITLRRLLLDNAMVRADASGLKDGDAVELALDARLAAVQTLVPVLTSPATARVDATGNLATQQFTTRIDALTNIARLSGDVSAARNGTETQVQWDVNVASDNLSVIQPIQRGAANLQLTGSGAFPSGDLQTSITGTTQGLDLGVAQIAPLIRPVTRLAGRVERRDGVLRIEDVSLANAEISAQGRATLAGAPVRATISVRLRDLGLLVSALPGAVRLEADVTDFTTIPNVTASLSGAGGIAADLRGRLGLPGGAVDLAVTGAAPLGLLQPFVAGRTIAGRAQFDLTLAGQPALQNLTGRVTTQETRISDPELGVVLQPLDLSVDLAGARARISAQGALNGAPIQSAGSVALTAPYLTDIAVTLNAVPFRFADILKTSVSGQIRLEGAANRSLHLGGDLGLSQTDIRVPDTGLGSLGAIPDIRHVRATGPVLQTLARSGRGPTSSASTSGGGGIALPLALSVRATEPIFVRGRGLDAVFGGAITLTGTAADPIPTGRFDLERGRLNILGQRLNLVEGAITATGRLVPRLFIVGEAETADVTARVTLDGPADAPKITLSAEPPLPEDEVLAQLFFGRSVSELSAFQLARLISSLAQLSGREGLGLGDSVRKTLGVDDFDIRIDQQTGEAELAAGRYLSENVYSEIELGAGGEVQINLNLDLNDTTRLRGAVSSTGETGIGIFWQKDY